MDGRITLLIFITCVLAAEAFAKPHTEAKSRDETEHFSNDPERHDVNFDHDAFLGKRIAKEYSKLTPEESREKLREIFKKIDKNKDGKVSVEEMKVWIAYVADVSKLDTIETRWVGVNPQKFDPLDWDEYTTNTYGPAELRKQDKETVAEYNRLIKMDKRRWAAADANKDGALSREEFSDFLFPEDKVHMRDTLIDELLDTVDTDEDGKVSEGEYFDDLARAYQTELKPGEPEPSWMGREREQFRLHRDTNHDGFMDRAEVAEWIMPSEYDPIDAEAQHLLYHADTDKDEFLTEEEVLDKQDLFISSQATNYGSALHAREEL